jgi:hypothetical protein
MAQAASVVQATQVLDDEQMGVLPPHWLLAVHCTQAPVPAQAGLP